MMNDILLDKFRFNCSLFKEGDIWTVKIIAIPEKKEYWYDLKSEIEVKWTVMLGSAMKNNFKIWLSVDEVNREIKSIIVRPL